MPDDLVKWLESLELGQYAATFADNAIDVDVLSSLTEADLEKIGVKLGHRKKLLKAIAALADDNPPIPLSCFGDPSPQTRELDEDQAAWVRHPGERRPVTMLFADITGSTGLTEKLDAEEAHGLLYGAAQRMCRAVEDNQGTVCRFMGDGVMAMFGAPVASEQHAVDACKAAIDMQQGVGNYARDVQARHGDGLKIRVGLHSGEVVVLKVGRRDKVEYDASGPTVPIAARMEQAARPGEIYLTAATVALAGTRIETEPLEPVSVKGISGRLPVFRLRRVRSAEESMTDTSRTPFVGRRSALHQFRGMLDICIEEAQGQAVYVRGEPGIGKTRLIEEFAKIAVERGVSIHRSLVLPFGIGKGQDAIRSLARSLLGIPSGSGKTVRQRAADKALSDGWLDPDQAVFLNDLLDLTQPVEQRAFYDAMDNAARNEGKRRVAAKLVSVAGAMRPVVVVVEDVHWAGAITLAHLATLVKTVADCPAMLVMTSRIEGDQLDPRWRSTTDRSPLFTIDLGPLRKQDSIALISEFIDPADPLAEGCLERAAGNPLFLEQLLFAAQEDSAAGLPDSIQSLVLARVDRLEPEYKQALQAASVLGQRFDADILRHLLPGQSCDCQELVAHNLIRPEGSGYLFSHALIQESVYGSLLKHQRRDLHGKAACWFAENDLTLYAHHLAKADDEQAPRAYLEAAEEQARQYRYETGIGLVERGLELSPQQTDRHHLTCLKADLLLDLGEVESSLAIYKQAEAHADNEVQLCDAWLGIASCKRVSTDYGGALKVLEMCEPVAVSHKLTLKLSRLHHLRGNLRFPLGNVDACREAHQRALEYAREAGSAVDEARALGGLGDAEFARGRMRSAYESLRMCVDQCREHGFGKIELPNLIQMTISQAFLASGERALRELSLAAQAASKVSHHRAEMNARAGICDVTFELGDAEQLEASTQRGLALAHKLKARNWEPLWSGFLAQAHYLRGDRGRAREVLEAAIQNESALPLAGGWLFGLLSILSDGQANRARALQAGERLREGGSMGEGVLYFYRFALEACLDAKEWHEVEKYARALEDFTRSEPLPWSDFFISRARVLAAACTADRDGATLHELHRLRDEAGRLGLNLARRALDEALLTA